MLLEALEVIMTKINLMNPENIEMASNRAEMRSTLLSGFIFYAVINIVSVLLVVIR